MTWSRRCAANKAAPRRRGVRATPARPAPRNPLLQTADTPRVRLELSFVRFIVQPVGDRSPAVKNYVGSVSTPFPASQSQAVQAQCDTRTWDYCPGNAATSGRDPGR